MSDTLSFGYDGDGGLGDRLLAAVLRSEKTATSSLAVEYLSGEPLPRVGQRLTLVDHSGRSYGVVETTHVTVVPLHLVGDDVAHDEGEGFADAAHWRRNHAAFWAEVADLVRAEAKDPGWQLRDAEPVVVHRFRLVQAGPPLVRHATDKDAVACSAVYAPYVSGTAVTFELDPPSVGEMAGRIVAAVGRYAWLVLEDEGRVVGYAYGGPWKARPAYGWACEVSVYLEPGRRRTGSGRLLYEALLARLGERGYRIAVAGMTLPNDASVGLHRALGFELVGVHRRIGWKHGAWHDVAWVQRTIGGGDDPPDPPR